MHSSRMHTAHNSSHGGVCLSVCWDTPLLGVGLETSLPPGCGPGDPSRPDPSTSPLGVGLETPLARPLNFPPWCGPGNLQGMLGYHPPRPPRPAARHAGIPPAMHAGIPPPMTRITDMCKNITLPQLRCGQ